MNLTLGIQIVGIILYMVDYQQKILIRIAGKIFKINRSNHRKLTVVVPPLKEKLNLC